MPDESSQSEEVQLVIRSAYQSADDLSFSCPKNWTIRQVKEHVSNVLSSHPSVATQRLIFSGASLQDDQIIENVLSQRSVVDGAQVFHLVISQPYTNQEVRRRPQAATTSASPPEPSPAPSSLTWEQWSAQYGQNAAEAHAQYCQYYNEYMRYYYAQQYYMSITGIQNANLINNAYTAPPPAQNNNAAPVGQAAAPPGERVDALEIFYRLFKLVILFSAVLLYSSFERFAIVLCAALFIYFIQLRRNHARNRAIIQAREQNAENNNVNNNNNGENLLPESEIRENSSEEENREVGDPLDTPPTMMAPPPPSTPTGMQIFFSACYSFITSFFASLVPDHPLPVDLN